MATQSIRDQITPLLKEIPKQVISWGFAAFMISFLGLNNFSTPWTIAFFMGAVVISYALFEVVLLYIRDVVGAGQEELGKDRASRRRLAIRYLAALTILLAVPIASYTFEYDGQPIIEYVWDFLRKDDSRFARRALREVADTTTDYDVKTTAVTAIGMTNAPATVSDLLSIGRAMRRNYEAPGKSYRKNAFFCQLAKSVGRHGNRAVSAIMYEYRSDKTIKDDVRTRIPSLVDQFNSQFSSQFKRLRAEVVDSLGDPQVTRLVEKELLEAEGDLAKRLADIEARHLSSLAKKEPYRRSYLDLLLQALLYVDFERENDAVYGIGRDVGFDLQQPTETRNRALSLFAQHGTLRDVPLLLNVAKHDSALSVRLTATEALPALGIKLFGKEKERRRRDFSDSLCD